MSTKNIKKYSRNYTQTPSKKNSITSLEIDDFWNDCFSTSCSSVYRKKNKQQLISQKNTNITQLYSRFPQFRSTRNETNLIENRKKEAMENCCRMHERAKESSQNKQMLIEEINNIKISNELANCTWYPKINKNFNSGSKPQEKTNKDEMYLRAIEWEYNKHIKQSKLRAESEMRDSQPISFRPQINSNPNLKNVFQNGQNIYDSQSNTAFFYRLEKARIDEKEKIELMNKGLTYSGRKIVKNLPNSDSSQIIRNCSKGDNYKENIHNELFSLKLTGTFF